MAVQNYIADGDLLDANLFNGIENNILNKGSKIKYLQITTYSILNSGSEDKVIFDYSTSYMKDLLINNNFIILKQIDNDDNNYIDYRLFYISNYIIENDIVQRINFGRFSLVPDENDSDKLIYANNSFIIER